MIYDFTHLMNCCYTLSVVPQTLSPFTLIDVIGFKATSYFSSPPNPPLRSRWTLERCLLPGGEVLQLANRKSPRLINRKSNLQILFHIIINPDFRFLRFGISDLRTEVPPNNSILQPNRKRRCRLKTTYMNCKIV